MMEKCRICLRHRKKLLLISTKVNGITFGEMMCAIANIKILTEDSCYKLCRHCREKLIQAYNFKIEIERAELILQETSNTKRICFSNLSDIKIDIEIDTDFKPILPAIDNVYQKLIENGTNTLSYNDTLIKKIECPSESYHENKTLSVGEFLNSIKNESDNDCDYQAYEIGADDYYSESGSNFSDSETRKKIKKHTKKRNQNEPKNSDTEKSRKEVPWKFPEKPIRPKFIEELRLVRAEPDVPPKRKRIKKPKDSKLKVCPYCGKLSKNLQYHILIHTGERKFKCDQCGSAFFTLPVLRSHIKQHSAVKKFKCDQCLAAYTTEGGLRNHKIRHQDVKNYVCNVCNKSFKRNPILKRHMMIHMFGNKPIQCELCPMTFLTKYNLGHHMRVHTGERPYKCEICSQPYSYKHDFNRHCLKKHGVFLKRRSVHVMNEEVLQQERALMRELALRAHGIIKSDEVENPFDGPQAALAYEQAMKAIEANKIPIIY